MTKRRQKAQLGTDTPRGERAEYVRTGISLPPSLVERLQAEIGIRRARGDKDVSASSIVRAALVKYLE